MTSPSFVNVKWNKLVLSCQLPGASDAISGIDLKKECIRLALTESDVLLVESDIKLIKGGKVLSDEDIISGAVTSSTTIIMIASEQESLKISETPRHLQRRIIDDLQTDGRTTHLKKATSSSSTTSSSLTLNSTSRIGCIQILNLIGLPYQDRAHQILLELANDIGIQKAMEKHDFRVGTLSELYPEGKVGIDPVCVLGLNKNMGQEILLRIRTDDLEGFRDMVSIRNTLYHELAHNLISPHDSNFYRLMRQIEKDVRELDWRQSTSRALGGNKRHAVETFAGSGGEDMVENDDVHPLSVYFLGGGAGSSASTSLHTFLPASILAGTAAILRLSTEELAVEQGCGCVTSPAVEIVSTEGEKGDERELALCLPCKDVSGDGGGIQYMSENNGNTLLSSTTATTTTIICPPFPPSDSLINSGGITEERMVDGVSAGTDNSVSTERSSAADFAIRHGVSIMTSVDESLAVVLSLDSLPTEKLFALRSGLEQMCIEQQSDIKESLTLLRTIIGNAKDIPDPKYQRVNISSKQFTRLLGRSSGAMEILKAVGFCQSSSQVGYLELVRNDAALLYMFFSIIDSCLTAIANTI